MIANAASWQDIAHGLEWSRDNAFKVIAHGAGGTKYFRKINDILEAYTTGSPFSIDLAMAVSSQLIPPTSLLPRIERVLE